MQSLCQPHSLHLRIPGLIPTKDGFAAKSIRVKPHSISPGYRAPFSRPQAIVRGRAGKGSASSDAVRPVSPIEVDQDSFVADGRPGLRMATSAFNRAWRTVSGLTWSSLAIEAQERPEA